MAKTLSVSLGFRKVGAFREQIAVTALVAGLSFAAFPLSGRGAPFASVGGCSCFEFARAAALQLCFS